MPALCKTGAGASASSFAALPCRARPTNNPDLIWVLPVSGLKIPGERPLKTLFSALFRSPDFPTGVLGQLRKDKGMRHVELDAWIRDRLFILLYFSAELASNCRTFEVEIPGLGQGHKVPEDRTWGLQQTTHLTGTEKNPQGPTTVYFPITR